MNLANLKKDKCRSQSKTTHKKEIKVCRTRVQEVIALSLLKALDCNTNQLPPYLAQYMQLNRDFRGP
jgi:hypothetical protein